MQPARPAHKAKPGTGARRLTGRRAQGSKVDKKTIIGHIDCPVCGFKEMQVKQDKNGHAYGHCTDCNAQAFTRNDHRDSQMRKRMRPVTVSVTVTGQEPAPTAPVTVTGTVPAPAPAPAKTAAPVKAAAPAPTKAPTKPAAPAPAPAPEKKPASSWFTPIMGMKNA